ncbi:MAG TPA: PP2C family protein-serine/threonine phosphatase [Vicinamibacterales bacterium]|jgi:serine phosphatase RsbU (regulator of sigma subunit)
MAAHKSKLPDRARAFLEAYTHGLKREDLPRLFTRDTREAYRFFARRIDEDTLSGLPAHKRLLGRARLLFWAFTLRLSPARRVLFGVSLLLACLGFVQLFRGLGGVRLPLPVGPFIVTFGLLFPSWADGAGTLFLSLVLVNLLVLLEVADRLSLKNDLEIAREIQYAMLPQAIYQSDAFEVFGLTRPANTVGGDFYDVQPLPDGRIVVTLGDVAGKGSPAALLMALLLAMFRTLVDEGLEAAALAERLNIQISRHSPASRFITLFFAFCDPSTGRLVYVNAGHMPGMLRRRDGRFESLSGGGIALGMFDGSRYESREATMEPGDTLVLYSDGVTEAENHKGQAFEEAGLQRIVDVHASDSPRDLAQAILRVVEVHAQETYLADDVTLLVVRRRTGRTGKQQRSA